MKIVGFDRFCTLLAQEFDVDASTLSRDTHVVDELAFDSLELLRLSIFIEMLAPIDMPTDVDFKALTLGAVYDHYAVNAATID